MIELKARLKVEALPDHLYTVNGFAAPSVSTICKPIAPYFNAHNSEPQTFGTIVHGAVSLDLQRDLYEEALAPEVLGCVNAARSFKAKYKLEYVASELPVGCMQPLYAGRIDVLFVDPHGEYWIPDWKTGYQYSDYKIRLAAYEFALRAMYARMRARRMAVYLNPDGTFKDKVFLNPLHLEVFKGLHNVWTFQQLEKRGEKF